MSRRKQSKIDEERAEKRKRAEADLEYFINLVHPRRLLGNIHREVIRWWTSPEAHNHQLLLLPRDHMKSALAAYWVIWRLTQDPTLRILYISSTANLAKKQLKFMKDILTCDAYRSFWPDMVDKDEARRELWNANEISLDHPKRREENIRDPSIFTAGLTSNIVGMHCDISVLDDVVVQSNAYTDEGREKVNDQYSFLVSIEGSNNTKQMVVGTRYHPKDLYNNLAQLEVNDYDSEGGVLNRRSLFDVMERQVEATGDGTGEFLWPRQQRSDGKWFGFDAQSLAEKREKYINKLHFRAQYYNDPYDISSSPIQRDLFQYYDPKHLYAKDGRWYFKNERLNVFASVDFAYSTSRKADYSAIVVIGVDGRHNYYILEIDRFKTDKPSDYFQRIFALYQKWGFRKIRCEVNAAQEILVKDLRDSYIRPYGLSLAIDEYRPSRWQGSKDERILATLEPKYANRQIWHYASGYCQVLEEELMFANPAHDDVKDALASVIDFASDKAPMDLFRLKKENTQQMFNFHSRFGGTC